MDYHWHIMETFNDIVTDLPEDVDMQYLRVSPQLEPKK